MVVRLAERTLSARRAIGDDASATPRSQAKPPCEHARLPAGLEPLRQRLRRPGRPLGSGSDLLVWRRADWRGSARFSAAGALPARTGAADAGRSYRDCRHSGVWQARRSSSSPFLSTTRPARWSSHIWSACACRTLAGRWSSPSIVDSASRLAARLVEPRARVLMRRRRLLCDLEMTREPLIVAAAGHLRRSTESQPGLFDRREARAHRGGRPGSRNGPRARRTACRSTCATRPRSTSVSQCSSSHSSPGRDQAARNRGLALPRAVSRDRPADGDRALPSGETLERKRRQLERWWQTVESSSGPATGLRTLFDVVAMPLFGALGFRATGATFERARIVVRLDDGASGAVGLIVTAWAARSSTAWRDVVNAARTLGAEWCFLLSAAVSLAGRRAWPRVPPERRLHAASTCSRHRASRHSGRSPAPGRRSPTLLATASGFQDRVRADLQVGVADALRAFGPVVRPGEHTLDESLTLVYRILFLLFAESRDLVPRSPPALRRGVHDHERSVARPRAGDRRAGLWDGAGGDHAAARASAAAPTISSSGRSTAGCSPAPPRRRSKPAAQRRVRRARTARRDDARRARAGRARHAAGPGRPRGDRVRRSRRRAARRRVRARARSRSDAVDGAATAGRDAHSRAARRPARSTRRSRSPSSSSAARSRRSSTARPPTTSSRSASSIRRWAAARFSSRPAGTSRARTSARSSTKAAARRPTSTNRARANIRRLIAERCLAGVDANPVAVQLARLSLWLDDARARQAARLSRPSPARRQQSASARRPTICGASAARAGDRPIAPLPLFDAGGLEDALRPMARPLAASSPTRRDDTVDDVRAQGSGCGRGSSGDESPLEPWRARVRSLVRALVLADGQPRRRPRNCAPRSTRCLRDDTTLHAGRTSRAGSTAARERRPAHRLLPLAARVRRRLLRRRRPRRGARRLRRRHRQSAVGDAAARSNRRGTRTPERRTRRGPRLSRFIRESGLYPLVRSRPPESVSAVSRALAVARAARRPRRLVLPWGLAADDGAATLRARLLDRSTRRHDRRPRQRARRSFPSIAACGSSSSWRRPGGRTREDARAIRRAHGRGDRRAAGARTTRRASAYPGPADAGAARARRRPRRAAFRTRDDRRDLDWLAHGSRARFRALGDPTGWDLRSSAAS